MGNEWVRNYYLEPGRVRTADRTANGVEARATAANADYQQLVNSRQNYLYYLYTGQISGRWTAVPKPDSYAKTQSELEDETLLEKEENW